MYVIIEHNFYNQVYRLYRERGTGDIMLFEDATAAQIHIDRIMRSNHMTKSVSYLVYQMFAPVES